VLAAALFAIIIRLLPLQEVYRSIEWQVIFFIAGMYVASLGMVHTGLAALIGKSGLGLIAIQVRWDLRQQHSSLCHPDPNLWAVRPQPLCRPHCHQRRDPFQHKSTGNCSCSLQSDVLHHFLLRWLTRSTSS